MCLFKQPRLNRLFLWVDPFIPGLGAKRRSVGLDVPSSLPTSFSNPPVEISHLLGCCLLSHRNLLPMGRCRAQMDVTLKLLMDIGDIRPGNGVLHVSTRDQTRHADLDEEGIITFQGNFIVFQSLSTPHVNKHSSSLRNMTFLKILSSASGLAFQAKPRHVKAFV